MAQQLPIEEQAPWLRWARRLRGPARPPQQQFFLATGCCLPLSLSPQNEQQAQNPHGELSSFHPPALDRVDCTQVRLWAERYHRNNVSQQRAQASPATPTHRASRRAQGLFIVSILKGFQKKVHWELLTTPKQASQEWPRLWGGGGEGVCWILLCKKLYAFFMHQVGAG